jgi:hypothetical protein
MDKKNYDSRLIGVFEIIGSYFVDVIYNHHYLLAKDLVRRQQANNLTDAYRATIINYMNGSSRDELFKIIVQKLHEFYQKNSGFSSVLLSEFQNKVLLQFIPPEYYQDFTDHHKDIVLKEIVVRTVNEFGEVILAPTMLRKIIDSRTDRDNVVQLQDRIVDIFILQREDYYAKFAREISKKNAGNMVDKSVLDKLKEAYVVEKKKACELMEEKERAASIVRQLLDKMAQQEKEIERMKREIDGLKAREGATSETHRREVDRPPRVQNRRKTPYPSPTRQASPPPRPPVPAEDDAVVEDNDLDDDEIHRRQQAAILARQPVGAGRGGGEVSNMSTRHESDGVSGARESGMPTWPDGGSSLSQAKSYALDDDPWVLS